MFDLNFKKIVLKISLLFSFYFKPAPTFKKVKHKFENFTVRNWADVPLGNVTYDTLSLEETIQTTDPIDIWKPDPIEIES